MNNKEVDIVMKNPSKVKSLSQVISLITGKELPKKTAKNRLKFAVGQDRIVKITR